MKCALWLLPVLAVLIALAIWTVPRLRQAVPVGPGQPSEAQVRLAQEWARAHARPMH